MPDRYTLCVRTGDLLRNARLRGELTQTELARRSGFTQAEVSRWESGAREPTLPVVARLTAACGLDVSLQLFKQDRSFHELALDQLRLGPWERVASLLPDSGALGAMRAAFDDVAQLSGGALVSGEIAAALHGGVRMLDAAVPEVVPGDTMQASAELEALGWMAGAPDDPYRGRHARWPHVHRDRPLLELVARPAGTRGHAELLRDAVTLPGVPLPVVSVRDLLRIAEASPWEQDRSRRLELRALLDLADEHQTAALAAAS